MAKQTSIEEFMKNFKDQEAEDRETTGSGEFEERTTLKAERDQVYAGYYIESYQGGIEGKYGANTAIRVTSPEGEKQTLWVNGYEETHFENFMKKLVSAGTVTVDDKGNLDAPLKVDFLRTQQQSERGNTYNRIMFVLQASGEEAQMELDSL